ncbi:Hypothetical predicted protein [Olea europaea subsp. europaea]|uniref:Uncharacterized protein n=1 Tax=Olea europaea subsp. europaea TaxID=158383 RepID=A0A8S0R1F0_OLEEU|nr:Hypothetical predicted protein [Olea europaea subsp. europaea]
MSVLLLESSFRVNPLTTNLKPLRKINAIPVRTVFISSKHSQEDFSSENEFAKLALVTLAAGVLTLGSIDPASAAKTGGRVGGQPFLSSAPRSSGPRINNSRSNVYINPTVAPLVGGFGYGFGMPFSGGCSCSPFPFSAPGPIVAVGIGSRFELFAFFLFLRGVSAVVSRIRGSRSDDDEEY